MDIAASSFALNANEPAMNREFRLVRPDELAQFWPLVKAGVEKVHERASDGWLPEDVYMALKGGTAQLIIGFVEQYYVGFVVLTPAIGWHGPQLHLWLLYSRGERDVLETFLPDLLELARQRGVKQLTAASLRRGWEKRAEQLGFHYTQSHYAREV